MAERFFKFDRNNIFSIAGFSFFSAILLSFLFEGQVFYALSHEHHFDGRYYIFLAMIGQFIGLISSPYLVKSLAQAKKVMLASIGLLFLFALPFFLPPSKLWTFLYPLMAFLSGLVVASWGYFLRDYAPKGQRTRSSAYALIFSNLLMILVNLASSQLGGGFGLALTLIFLAIAGALIGLLPTNIPPTQQFISKDVKRINQPLMTLFIFVAIITINSGLMYQVVSPAFAHYQTLVSWYWALPYIAALLIVKNFLNRSKKPWFLYIAMSMLITSFILFMVLDRSAWSFILIDTVMLGSFGIFDLFWWSILGDMLDFDENAAKIFGLGLSANILGILIGNLIAMLVQAMDLPSSNVTVIALTVVSISLILLPVLNWQLTTLLSNNIYLMSYEHLSPEAKKNLPENIQALTPLTGREKEVLALILEGKSNRDIAIDLFITENTVKTHIRNIFSKYQVDSRTALISMLLKSK